MENDQQKFQTWIAYVAIFFSWAGIYLYTPTLATYILNEGGSSVLVGVTVGSFGLIQALFRAPIGILSDRLENRRIIVTIGMLAGGLGSLGMFFFGSVDTIFWFRALGSFSAATWPVTNVLITSIFINRNVSGVIAKNNSVNAIGNIFGMLLGGVIVSVAGQRTAFAASAVLGLIAFTASLFLQEPRNKNNTFSRNVSVVHIAGSRNLRAISLLALIFQLVITGSSNTFTPIYAQEIGANSYQLGVLAMLSMLGLMVAGILRNQVVRLFKNIRMAVFFAFVFLSVSTGLIPHTKYLHILLIFQFIQGFWGYLILVILMGECIVPFAKEDQGTAMGLFQSFFGIGMFIGPLISALLNKFTNLTAVFSFLCIIAGLGGVMTLLNYETNKTELTCQNDF